MSTGIIGIGLDIVELERVNALLSGPTGERFIARVLTEREREALPGMPFRRRAQYVAGRFAMKEAVAKALGCGIGKLVGFQDIEALPDEYGKPNCRLSDGALSRLRFASHPRIHAAITHERSMAAASVVLEQDG